MTESSSRPNFRGATLRRLLGRVKWIALIVVPLFLGLVLLIVIFQRRLIYVPHRVTSLDPAESGMPLSRVVTVTVPTADGLTLGGWLLLPPSGSDPEPDAPSGDAINQRLEDIETVVLLLPGNGGHRGYRSDLFSLLTDLGAAVLTVDYRGYAENPGTPTEAGLRTDAAAMWTYLTNTLGVPPDRVVVFGESLGGGVATDLTARLCAEGAEPKGLVILSSFSSLADAGSVHYPWLPVSRLLWDRFDSRRAIGSVTVPYLHLHGNRDRIVPIELGQRLFEAAPEQSASGIEKTFITLEDGDHNNLMRTHRGELKESLRKFFAKL